MKNNQNKKEEKGIKGTIRFEFKQIGTIRTPYIDNAPYQPVEDEGDFRIVVEPEYTDGLYKLDKFQYIYVLYYINKLMQKLSMLIISPPWTGGTDVGVFASRSPIRPNRIGISIVRIKRIVKNTIFTSGLDVFDKTPLLDVKPYIKDLDAKCDANYGWIEEMDNYKHLLLHIKGIPHNY